MTNAKPKAKRGGAVQFVIIVVVAIAVALGVEAIALKPYRIPSPSMVPTLKVGDRVLVNRLSHRLGAGPKVGQILVFNPPQGADPMPPICGVPSQGAGSDTPCSSPTPRPSTQTFIKRVVAVAGDRIAIRAGEVIRNGKLQKEPFINPCLPGGSCDFRNAITVPKDHVFMMGDNRGESDDSRFWGPIPVSWVIGQAFVKYWPPARIGVP